MTSVKSFKDFISERLKAVAAEIFGVFQETIVQYEEEIFRQRKLLETCRKPETSEEGTGVSQQRVCKEEEDQEDSDPPQVKEEQDEEIQTFIFSPALEESEPELLCHGSYVPEGPDETGGGRHGASESSPSNNGYISDLSATHLDALTGKKYFKCDACGKSFQYQSKLNTHRRTHTGERPFSCSTCNKTFRYLQGLNSHLKTHVDERPYSCPTCGKSFRYLQGLNGHIRLHTGEKPYSCSICGKSYNYMSGLSIHKRTHTGEKPFSCKVCGKAFRFRSVFKKHVRVHLGQKSDVRDGT